MSQKHFHTLKCCSFGPFYICKDRFHLYLRRNYSGRPHHLFVDVCIIIMLGILIFMVAWLVSSQRHLQTSGDWNQAGSAVKIEENGTASISFRYFSPEGDQLGSGPIEPRVGEKTRIWLLINVVPPTDTEASTFFIDAAEGSVNWTGRQSMTRGISAHIQDSTLTWRHCSEKPCEDAQAAFELSITPQKENINLPLLAIKKARWLAESESHGMIESEFPIIPMPDVLD